MTGFTFRVTQDFDLTTYRRMLAEIRANPQVVQVGIPAGPQQDGVSLAMIGAAHEFGVPGKIPERPWLYTSVVENRAFFIELNKRNLAAILKGQQTIKGALGQLGAAAEGRAKQKIYTGPFTPNAPETIRRKGSSKPLIDKGALVQSIKFEVTEPSDD